MSRKESIYTNYGFYKKYILLELTLKCTLKCTHCIVDAGMGRTEEMSTERASEWIGEIAENNDIEVIVFTGGEPFLDLKRLKTLLGAANEFNLKVSIVTSCMWAKNYDEAINILSNLHTIANLSISTDRYHLDFVALEQIEDAIRAALSLNIEVGVFISLENSEDDFVQIFEDHIDNKIFKRIKIFTQYVHLTGRAADTKHIVETVEIVKFGELKNEGCKAVYAPIILPDGNVMACCGDAITDPQKWEVLSLGNLNKESLSNIYERYNHNYLIHALRLFGPKELAKIIFEEIDPCILEKSYEKNNMCSICSEICTNSKAISYLEEYFGKNIGI